MITLDPAALVALLTTEFDSIKKIRKRGPFRVVRLAPEYSSIAYLMDTAVRQLKELPDFSGDKGILVTSDFGGEHSSALFNTYSFVFVAQDKSSVFEQEIKELRSKHGLLDTYSEFKFKDLAYGPRSRALPGFLSLVDKYIHGAVVTIAVEKKIETLFGPSKQQAHARLVETLAQKGLGDWTGAAAEKVLRVCHFLAILSSLMLCDRQKMVWYCDNDTINENGKKRSFQDTGKIFESVSDLYAIQKLDGLGFGKSFADKGYMDDILSIADFAAGVAQDLLKGHVTNENIPGGEEKIALIKWMAEPATFLSKINIQISRLENGELGAGLVAITPK